MQKAAFLIFKSAFQGFVLFVAKVRTIIAIFKAIPDTFTSIGSAIVTGIRNGITGAWDSLKEFLMNSLNSLIPGFNLVKGISSFFGSDSENVSVGGIQASSDSPINRTQREIINLNNASRIPLAPIVNVQSPEVDAAGGADINLSINLDGEKIASAVAKREKLNNARN